MPKINSSFTSKIRNPAGLTLLDYLAKRFTYHATAEWSALLALGRLELEGVPAQGTEVLREGQRLKFHVVDYDEPDVPTDFKILAKSEQLCLVHKPAGMPVHKTGKIFFQTLANLLRENLGDDTWSPLNRLDRETGGLVAFARGSNAARSYAPTTEGVVWDKLYVAVTASAPPADSGTIDKPLAEVAGSAIRCQMHVVPGGKEAKTVYRLIGAFNGRYLLALCPVTGRKHQLRAHLAAVGAPIVGDKIYSLGGEPYLKRAEDRLTDADLAALGSSHHLLHAVHLSIRWPAGGISAWDWDCGSEFLNALGLSELPQNRITCEAETLFRNVMSLD